MSNESNEEKQAAGKKFKLDAATITSVANIYPADVREDIIWLGDFTRQHCSKNLDVLKSKAKALKFNKVSSSYFYKLLTGRYQKDGEFLGSKDNFRQIVDALRKQFRLAADAGKFPFIETGTWHLINDYITIIQKPERINKFGLIIKPTGSQGTACLKHFRDLNNSYKTVLVDSPETPTLGKFMTDLAMAYGGQLSWTTHQKHEHIVASVNATRTIIIDNIQRLYNANKGGNQPIFHFIQKIQEETGCTIIMSCTPEFQNTLITDTKSAPFFEQFVGRIGGVDEFLILPAYTPREDLLQIAAAFHIPTTEKFIELLEKVSQKPGRVRVLFGVLQKAKIYAAKDNIDVTYDHLLRASNKEKVEVQGE